MFQVLSARPYMHATRIFRLVYQKKLTGRGGFVERRRVRWFFMRFVFFPLHEYAPPFVGFLKQQAQKQSQQEHNDCKGRDCFHNQISVSSCEGFLRRACGGPKIFRLRKEWQEHRTRARICQLKSVFCKKVSVSTVTNCPKRMFEIVKHHCERAASNASGNNR